jgi:hypothetical protein
MQGEAQNDSPGRQAATRSKAHIEGGGAIAQDGSIAAGLAAIAIGGSVGGNVYHYVIQQTVAGLERLPTDYKHRIADFVDEYLGTGEHPVPFGGRRTEIDQLNAWLETPGAPAYALLTAPAGRGKSALLVRWMASLQAEARVIFLPVSLRFNTAQASVILTALAARLAEVYREPLPSVDLSAEQWRATCRTYLERPPPEGQPLVVILDGLDEATDWRLGPDLFPRHLPPNVRAVVSARLLAGDMDAQGWCRRLGWDRSRQVRSFSLEPLTLGGLHEVFNSMGNPLDRLATQVDVIGELFRLTKGDPLLIRLYIEALLDEGEQAATLRPNDLQALRPGLEGYFERWWEEQLQLWAQRGADPLTSQREVLDFFRLCATALGPLTRDDIAALVGTGPLTSGLQIKLVADQVNRFIIGDGQYQGYTFSHPRLSYYFQKQMAHEERQQWQQRFLAYGHDTLAALNARILAPPQASAYVVRFYGAHLDHAQATPAAYFALLSEGWLRAWEALEGSYTGFLTDVDRAWEHADTLCSPPPWRYSSQIAIALTIQFKAALCHASVASLSANIAPHLLNLAVQYDLLSPTQALSIARQKTDDHQQADALRILVPLVPPPIRDEILGISQAIENVGARSLVLAALAPHLPRPILDAAKIIEDEQARARVLAALAPHLPQEVLDALQTIETEEARVHVLVTLASHLPEKVLAIAGAIRYKGARACTLVALIPYLPQQEREAVLQAALHAARTARDKGTRSFVLSALSPYLPQKVLATALTRRWDITSAEACKVLIDVVPHLSPTLRGTVLDAMLDTAMIVGGADKETYAFVLAALAPYRPQLVLASLWSLTDDKERARVLAALASHLPQTVLDTIEAIHHEEERAFVLAALAPHLRQEQRLALLQAALDRTRGIEDDKECTLMLNALIPHLPQEQCKGAVQATLKGAQSIKKQLERASVLITLAPHLPQEVLDAAWTIEEQRVHALVLMALASHLPQEVFEAAWAIEEQWGRALVLAALASHLPRDVLAAARSIGGKWEPARVLTALAPHLPREVLDATRTIKHQAARALVLAALAPHLPGEVFDAAWTIRSEWERARVLAALVSHLPQEVLDETRTIKHEAARALVLAALAPHLPQEVLSAARTIEHEGTRIRVLTALVSHLPQEVLDATRTIKHQAARALVLAALAPHLPQEVLSAARTIEHEGTRIRVLAALAPNLPQAQHEAQATLDAVRLFADGWARARLLTTLGPYLFQAAQRGAVLQAALDAALVQLGRKERPV